MGPLRSVRGPIHTSSAAAHRGVRLPLDRPPAGVAGQSDAHRAVHPDRPRVGFHRCGHPSAQECL
eukprot:13328180-Alexandrium_andersonii.AAC.1